MRVLPDGWSASRCRPATRGDRRGFTVIEALVVVAIIGLLAGLVVPAVQAAREAARRVSCVSNMRQVGVAMHAYHASHNMFPPNQSPDWASNRISGLTFLLPHLEQHPLYAAINFDLVGVESPDHPTVENRTARNTRVAVLLCPSDGEPAHLNSYRLNRGRFGFSSNMPFDGPFGLGALPSQATVTDGLSQTAFLSERYAGTFAAGRNGSFRDIKIPNSGNIVIDNDGEFREICANAKTPGWDVTAGRYWMYNGLYYSDYNHNGRPNDPLPSCGRGFMSSGYFGWHPPRSFHPGGVNLLMGDGRVTWVADAVSARIWTAMGTHESGD